MNFWAQLEVSVYLSSWLSYTDTQDLATPLNIFYYTPSGESPAAFLNVASSSTSSGRSLTTSTGQINQARMCAHHHSMDNFKLVPWSQGRYKAAEKVSQ